MQTNEVLGRMAGYNAQRRRPRKDAKEDVQFKTKKPLPWYQPALAQAVARRGRAWKPARDCQFFAVACCALANVLLMGYHGREGMLSRSGGGERTKGREIGWVMHTVWANDRRSQLAAVAWRALAI